MSLPTAAEDPVQALQDWLTDGWNGPLQPSDVIALHGEDAEERDAWFFYLVLPDPVGETWDADQFAELQRAFRDKALEVGLPYPWYVIPRTAVADDAVPEDDTDLPDEG